MIFKMFLISMMIGFKNFNLRVVKFIKSYIGLFPTISHEVNNELYTELTEYDSTLRGTLKAIKENEDADVESSDDIIAGWTTVLNDLLEECKAHANSYIDENSSNPFDIVSKESQLRDLVVNTMKGIIQDTRITDEFKYQGSLMYGPLINIFVFAKGTSNDFAQKFASEANFRANYQSAPAVLFR